MHYVHLLYNLHHIHQKTLERLWMSMLKPAVKIINLFLWHAVEANDLHVLCNFLAPWQKHSLVNLETIFFKHFGMHWSFFCVDALWSSQQFSSHTGKLRIKCFGHNTMPRVSLKPVTYQSSVQHYHNDQTINPLPHWIATKRILHECS